MTTNYTTLSAADVVAELSAVARDARAVFGRLDERQLNWQPDAKSWSVAQCFDHLLRIHREMFAAIDAAMDASIPRTIWQRLPLLPRVLGPMLIKSQTPEATRKFTAPAKGAPAASAIDGRIIERFVAYQQEAAARVASLAGRDPARIVMASPFVSFMVYSVLDGWRLIAAHERRHFEQARRVIHAPGFPVSVDSAR